MSPWIRRVALLLAFVGTARAQDEPSSTDGPVPAGQKSVAAYLSDLESDKTADRLAAARTLKAQLLKSQRVAAHAREGSLARDEARAQLVELEERLPQACQNSLAAYDDVVIPCSDALAALGTKEALPLLEQKLAGTTSRAARKHLEAAIAALR